MRAVVFSEHGGPEVLRVSDVPDPVAGHGEVLVRVHACALNGLDIFARRGATETPMTLPHISGSDIAGEVREVAGGVDGVKPGDRVVVNPRLICGQCRYCLAGEQTMCEDYRVIGWHRPGGYAELVAVPARNVRRIPPGIDMVDASAIPIAYTTAWRMLKRARVRPGDTVLVLGASGGVASAAVQSARLAGARVLVTSSSPEKLERAAELGAEGLIDHRKESLEVAIQAHTAGRGVDVIVQTQGGPTWRPGLRCLRRGGRVVVCAAMQGSDPQEDLGLVAWHQLEIIGSTGGTPLDFEEVTDHFFRRRLRAVIDRRYPLHDAREAQEYFEGRQHFGKIVLTV